MVSRSTWTLLPICHALKFLWSHLQPAAYTMHVITVPSSVPPMQFTQRFRQNTCLFTLWTRCISCFRSQCSTFFLLFIQIIYAAWQKDLQVNIQHIYHHHVVPLVRISLTLFRHFSLSFIASGKSSGLHPVSSHSSCMFFLLVVLLLLGHMWGSIGVYHLWTRLCFSSSVLRVWFV